MVLKLHEWPSFQTLEVLSRFMGGSLTVISWLKNVIVMAVSLGSLKVLSKGVSKRFS